MRIGLARAFLLVAAALVFVFPVYFMLVSSAKPLAEFMVNPLGLPHSIYIDNFVEALERGRLLRLSINSVIVTSVATILVVILGSMVGWAVAQGFRASNAIFILFLVGLMVPVQTIMVPLYMLARQLGLANTLAGLILVYVATMLPFAVAIMTRFLRQVPSEILDAARLDGASTWGLFARVAMPLSKPAIITVVVLVAVLVWNDFFVPLILVFDPDLRTLPVGMMSLRGEFRVNIPVLFAAMVLISLPVLVVFGGLQRYLVAGLTSGAVKE